MLFEQPEGQVAHWFTRLQDYDFDTEHRPRERHINADALSHKLWQKHGCCPSCGYTEFVATVTLLENKHVGQTRESWEGEFSLSASEIAEAQCQDPDIHPVILKWKKQDPYSQRKNCKHAVPLREQYMLSTHYWNWRTLCWSWSLKTSGGTISLESSSQHDEIEAGHLRRFKSLHKVQARSWRPGIASAVKDHCNSIILENDKNGLLNKAKTHQSIRLGVTQFHQSWTGTAATQGRKGKRLWTLSIFKCLVIMSVSHSFFQSSFVTTISER